MGGIGLTQKEEKFHNPRKHQTFQFELKICHSDQSPAICLGHCIKGQKSDKTRIVAGPGAGTSFCSV